MNTAHLVAYVGPTTLGIVLAAAATDLEGRRIPNGLTFGAWLVALPVQMALHGAAGGALVWAAGWLAGLALLLPFYMVRGMAAGDVKLLAAVGAWVGAPMTLHIALLSFVIGGAWGLAIALRRGRAGELLRNVTTIFSAGRGAASHGARSIGHLPYGAVIAAGTMTVLVAAAR